MSVTVFKEFLQVGAGLILPPPTPPVINLDGTGLKIEWAIERTRTATPDRGTIMIYNLSMAARLAIHEAWKKLEGTTGYILDLSIGWGGLIERIFRGDAWKVVPEQRVDVDIVTTFEVGDGNRQVRDAVVGQNFAKVSVDVILTYLVTTILKVPFDPAAKAKVLERAAQLPVQSWNNYVLAGDPQDRLDELVDMLGLEWKIHQGFFIVTDKGNAATASPIAEILSAQSGLLEWDQKDDGGISVTALANPNVRPGTQIQVRDSFGIAVGALAHRVETVTFRGSTDGESIMEIVGRKAVLV